MGRRWLKADEVKVGMKLIGYEYEGHEGDPDSVPDEDLNYMEVVGIEGIAPPRSGSLRGASGLRRLLIRRPNGDETPFGLLDTYVWLIEEEDLPTVTQGDAWNGTCPSCGRGTYTGFFSVEHEGGPCGS